MDIKNKQTALDDEAEIYQRREEESSSKTEREKLAELSFKGKVQYLWDYYALKAFFVLVGVGLLVSLLVFMLRPKPDRVADITILDSPWYPQAVQDYSDILLKHLELDKEANEVLISDGLRFGGGSDLMAVTTHMAGGDLDILIGTREAIVQYSENGALVPLDTLPADILALIPEEDRISSDKIEDEGLRDYAFNLKGTAFTKYVDPEGMVPTDMYLGVCRNTRPERSDNIAAIVRIMITGK